MLISIEGNIGVGKSTILEKLKKNKEFKCIPEPIEKWKNLGGHNLLDLFYKEPEKHSTCFQLYTMLTLFNERIKTHNENYIISERSLKTGINVFCKSLYKKNLLTNIEFLLCKEYFTALEKISPPVQLFSMRIDLVFIFYY